VSGIRGTYRRRGVCTGPVGWRAGNVPASADRTRTIRRPPDDDDPDDDLFLLWAALDEDGDGLPD